MAEGGRLAQRLDGLVALRRARAAAASHGYDEMLQLCVLTLDWFEGAWRGNEETQWKHVAWECNGVCACLDLWRSICNIVCKCAIVKFYMTCNSNPFRNAKVGVVWQNTRMD